MPRAVPLLAALLSLPFAARAEETLTVLLDWFVNPNHAPIIVAREIGAFERAGLRVELVPPADPTMPPRLVAAGHGDIALDYQPQLLVQVANGLPLTRIGALVDHTLSTLETLDGDGIATLADLKGKRIGYNEVGGGVNLAEINRMLAGEHLSLRDVTLVNVGTALATSLLTHRIDAIGVDRNFETFELRDKGATPIGFDYEAHGVPDYDALIYVVRRDRASDPRLPRFLAATREGAARIKADPEEAWSLFTRAYPALDNPLNHDAWRFSVPYYASDPAGLDRDKYRAYAEFLAAEKVIPAAPPLESYTAEIR